MTPEAAKAIVENYAQVFEAECGTTCKVLAAVKDDTRDYRPDPRSRTAWELATHLALDDYWFLNSVITGTFAQDPAGRAAVAETLKTSADLAIYYKGMMTGLVAKLRALSDEEATREVDFFGMMKRPAAAFLGLANNHSIHHRGQLAAYLRAMGSKVPAMYGGSADEPMQGA